MTCSPRIRVVSQRATALMRTRRRKRAMPPSWQRRRRPRHGTGGRRARRRLVAMPVTLRPEIASLAPVPAGPARPRRRVQAVLEREPVPPASRRCSPRSPARASTATRTASAAALRVRLAERHGVTVDEVHVGAGSVSILHQLVQAAAGAGDEVLYSWRSFEAYPGHRHGRRRDERAGAEPSRRRARPRRDGGRRSPTAPGSSSSARPTTRRASP